MLPFKFLTPVLQPAGQGGESTFTEYFPADQETKKQSGFSPQEAGNRHTDLPQSSGVPSSASDRPSQHSGLAAVPFPVHRSRPASGVFWHPPPGADVAAGSGCVRGEEFGIETPLMDEKAQAHPSYE